MQSNFISKGYYNLKKEIKESITQKYKSDLDTLGFFKKFRIKRIIKFEIKMELQRFKKGISDQALFFKKWVFFTVCI